MQSQTPARGANGRTRPGGRTARVRTAVLAAALEVLSERGFDRLELPEVARRARVHATTVYRRWPTKARLIGEAVLERGQPLTPTPDTGRLRGDLEALLAEGAALLRTPPVRALFEVLLSEWTDPSPEIATAREGFWAAHVGEVEAIVQRAAARSELPASTEPSTVVELLIGPALVHALLLGSELRASERREIVARALTALGARDHPDVGGRPRDVGQAGRPGPAEIWYEP